MEITVGSKVIKSSKTNLPRLAVSRRTGSSLLRSAETDAADPARIISSVNMLSCSKVKRIAKFSALSNKTAKILDTVTISDLQPPDQLQEVSRGNLQMAVKYVGTTLLCLQVLGVSCQGLILHTMPNLCHYSITYQVHASIPSRIKKTIY